MLNALGIGTSIVGGLLGNSAARRAGRAQQQAANQAQGYLDSAQQGFQPYAQAGTDNLNRLNTLMGGDYSGFMSSPDYLAAQQEGMKALDRGAAARGALYSGGADADRISFGSNLASQQLNTYRNALSGLAGMGLGAQGSIADIYGQRANVATGAGNAAANTAMQRGANWQNTLGNLWSFGADYLGSRGLGGGSANIPTQPLGRMNMPLPRIGG
jgi:hypothetical protein